MKTGEIIGALAREKGINLRKLALKANVPYNTIYAIVHRKSDRIERETIQRIAGALEVEPWELMGYDGSIRVSVPPEQQPHCQPEKSAKKFSGTLAQLAKGFPAEDKLKWALPQLTDEGKEKVADYAMDLAKIPEYCRQDAPSAVVKIIKTITTDSKNKTPPPGKPPSEDGENGE